ncbi:hypothetical protein A2U01_0114743, partial [Trifolium medium]|nr:hypothetical protein [Trifolium medium]
MDTFKGTCECQMRPSAGSRVTKSWDVKS